MHTPIRNFGHPKLHNVLQFLLLGLLLVGCGSDSTQELTGSPLSASQEQQISAALDQIALEETVETLSLSILGDNGKSWTTGTQNTGIAAIAAVTDAQKRFRVGSATKTFVATRILQLADSGQLNLEDSLEHWLPQYDSGDNFPGSLTIRSLLNHSSGICNYVRAPRFNDTQDKAMLGLLDSSDYAGITPEVLIELARTDTTDGGCRNPQQPLHESWTYSNTNYILLGRIAERADTSESIEAQIRTHFIEPLELHDTLVPDPDPVYEPQHMQGWLWLDQLTADSLGIPRAVDVSHLHPNFAWMAGNMVSTPADLARWMREIATGDIISDQMRQQRDDFLELGDLGYGLGMVYDPAAGTIGHRGQINGFDCSMQYALQEDLAMAACVNRTMEHGKSAEIFIDAVLNVLRTGNAATASVGLGPRGIERPQPAQTTDPYPPAMLTEY